MRCFKKQTDRFLMRVNAMNGKASKAWGDYSESSIKEGAIEAFKAIGFPVGYYYENEEASYEDIEHPHQSDKWEFDLIVLSDKYKIAIVTEVKTTLCRSDVNRFVKRLKKFLDFMKDKSKHKQLDECGKMLVKLLEGKKIYAAMGYVNLHKKEKKIIEHAQNNHLMVISATKNSAKVVTPQDFKPQFK